MKTKIDAKVKESMRAQDKIAMSLFRELKSAIINFETAGKTIITARDPDILKIINSVLKQHQESKEAYEKANRPESVKDEERYISLLNELLPPVISDTNLEEILTEIAKTVPFEKKSMGIIIKKVKEVVEGKGFMVEGEKIANLVKSKLI